MDEQEESKKGQATRFADKAKRVADTVKKVQALSWLFGSGGLILAGGLILTGIALMVIGFAIGKWGENTNPTSGSVNCASWSSAPSVVQNAIQSAASQVGINPAMLGTIFLSENGNSWSKVAAKVADGTWENGPWTTSRADAQGPFQFLTSTFNSFSTGNIQNFNDASLAAAKYIKHIEIDVKPVNESNLSEIEVKQIAGGYNGGPHYQAYRTYITSGTLTDGYPKNDTIDYMKNAWTDYQNLSKACDTLNLIPMSVGDKFMPTWDRSYMAKDPVATWLKTKAHNNLVPTGITLHYTGPAWKADDPQSLITDWAANGNVFNNFVVDPNGKVFQIVPGNVHQNGSGTGQLADHSANSFTIGIEIAGTGIAGHTESSMMKGIDAQDTKQADAVVQLINDLKSLYPSIDLSQGNPANFAAKKGIFGHFQTQGVTGVGCIGDRSHVKDPGIRFMEWIWQKVSPTTTNDPCGFNKWQYIEQSQKSPNYGKPVLK